MKIFKHIRGKSDTDFYIDKLLLDNIHYNIKSYKPTNENNGNDDIDISYSNPAKNKKKKIEKKY